VSLHDDIAGYPNYRDWQNAEEMAQTIFIVLDSSTLVRKREKNKLFGATDVLPCHTV